MNQESLSPLTLIAVFAGVIEASALASLPFLSEQSQSIYTWFLVGFPFFLTVLFFLTLNFNTGSLFAPEKHEPGSSCQPPSSATGPSSEQTPAPHNPTMPDEAIRPSSHDQGAIIIAISGSEGLKMIENHVLRMIERPPPSARRWVLYNLDARVCIHLSVEPMLDNAETAFDEEHQA